MDSTACSSQREINYLLGEQGSRKTSTRHVKNKETFHTYEKRKDTLGF